MASQDFRKDTAHLAATVVASRESGLKRRY
jgi:hypothetical protein